MRKSSYSIVLIVVLGLIISGCIFHVVPPLGQNGSIDIVKDVVSYKTNLIAGQHTVAGFFTVSNDDENLFVIYETVDNWLINETHLYVDTIVPTKSAPGKFPYKHEKLGGVTTDTYEIPLEDLGVGLYNKVYIAAHADLIQEETEETGWAEGVEIEPGKNWAMYFEYNLFYGENTFIEIITNQNGIATFIINEHEFCIRVFDSDSKEPIENITCRLFTDGDDAVILLIDPEGRYIPRLSAFKSEYSSRGFIWKSIRDFYLELETKYIDGGSHLIYIDEYLPEGLTRDILNDQYTHYNTSKLKNLKRDLRGLILKIIDLSIGMVDSAIVQGLLPAISPYYNVTSAFYTMDDLLKLGKINDIAEEYEKLGYGPNQKFEIWKANYASADFGVVLVLPTDIPETPNLPQAYIDLIEPNPAFQGEEVTFKGHGVDEDGEVWFYRWESDIDGFLNNLPSFTMSDLSIGEHTISFKVFDAGINLSEAVNEKLIILPSSKVEGGTAIPWTFHSDSAIMHQINVFWNVYEGANGYKVYRQINNSNDWQMVFQGEGDISGELGEKREWYDQDVQLGNTYEYYVVAYGDDWETNPNFLTGSLSQFLPAIYLESPSDQSMVSDPNPTLQWTPLGGIPAGFNGPSETELLFYDATTNELIWQALFVDVATSSVTYNQDGQATASLIPGHTYGWKVRNFAYDQNMEDVITQSEYWEFIFGTSTGPVHNLTKNIYYNTIQEALDDADSLGGDTIEVDDGTYDESITFPSGKVIILQSLNGASSTTIRGNNSSSTVTFDGSLEDTTLEGFTITHADGESGRGIYIIHSNLSIENCAISGNNANGGGGICNWGSILTITGSIISGNYARAQHSNAFGGGIYNVSGGTLIINESDISDNYASGGGGYTYYPGFGGGIRNAGTLNITGSTISGNHAGGEGGASGGGISSGGTLTITGSTISDNYAQCRYGASGGGIAIGGILTITGSTISDNYGSDDGGIYLGSSGTFTIGGSSDTDKNIICGNYKIGELPSLDQQVRDTSGSLYEIYKNTNYISAYCE